MSHLLPLAPGLAESEARKRSFIDLWLIAQSELIEQQQVPLDVDRARPYLLSARVGLMESITPSREAYVDHIAALRRKLLSRGWCWVEREDEPERVFLRLHAYREPIVVHRRSGPAFRPAVEDLPPPDEAVAAIVSRGAWRFEGPFLREYVPAHEIERVTIGADLPDG
ncbi:MAG TPA: hypothetical protein VF263_26745 [Longimicrobiaceae bacterium]